VSNDLALFDDDGHFRSSEGFVNFVPSEPELQTLKQRQAAAVRAGLFSETIRARLDPNGTFHFAWGLCAVEGSAGV
jgi:hypothetical protein